MAKLSDFQRLSGLGTYLPSLEEAREGSHLDVDEIPEMLGTSERCLEIAQVEVTDDSESTDRVVAENLKMDPHKMSAPELAAYVGSKHGDHDDGMDSELDSFYRAAGKAHHVSAQAHDFSTALRSGEIPSSKEQHAKAHELHSHAFMKKQQAYDMAHKLGLHASADLHMGEKSGHEKALLLHGKKSGKYK